MVQQWKPQASGSTPPATTQKPPKAQASAVVTSSLMTAAEAESITTKINESAGALCDLLAEAHDREAWRALGFDTWASYATERLQVSRQRSYQLIDQSRAKATLSAAVSTMVDISERAAREIKPKLKKVAKDAKRRVAKGVSPKAAVRAAVSAARKPPKPAAPKARAAVKVRDKVVGHIKPVSTTLDPDKVAELATEFREACDEIKQLEEQNKALAATNRGAEITRLVKRYQQLEGRLRGAMTTAKEAERQATYATNRLKDIRKLLKVESDREIVPAIRTLLK